MTFVYCCLLLIQFFLFVSLTLSPFHPIFFLYMNRSVLYCESRMMVMLVIMTFIYHIRSVIPIVHIYLYINTGQPNRFNSIQATSCVNKSTTDQFLTFSLFALSLYLFLVHSIDENIWSTRTSEFTLLHFFIIYRRSMIFLSR